VLVGEGGKIRGGSYELRVVNYGGVAKKKN